MRSLTPTTVAVSEVASGAARAGRVAVDPETGVLYATVEAPAEFGLDISIVKLTASTSRLRSPRHVPTC